MWTVRGLHSHLPVQTRPTATRPRLPAAVPPLLAAVGMGLCESRNHGCLLQVTWVLNMSVCWNTLCCVASTQARKQGAAHVQGERTFVLVEQAC